MERVVHDVEINIARSYDGRLAIRAPTGQCTALEMHTREIKRASGIFLRDAIVDVDVYLDDYY